MKNLTYLISFSLLIYSCNSEINTNDDLAIIKSFQENSKTMQILFDSYANESVDYSRFSENAILEKVFFCIC